MSSRNPLYVLDDFRGRGGGQCQDRHFRREDAAEFGDTGVGRAEVIPPLRNAMCFVHSEEVHVHVAHFGLEDFRGQPFRGDIEELVVPEDAVLQCHDDFLP